MTIEASLLRECAAHPDDDAPRLVLADQIGGERGELIVIQCELARGQLEPEVAAAHRARERELLTRHGEAWAGELARTAQRWRFRRGLVEAARVDLAETITFTEHPCLHTVTVCGGWEHVDRLREARLRGLGFAPGHLPNSWGNSAAMRAALGRVAAWPELELHALALHRVDQADLDLVSAIAARTSLEHLWLFDARFTDRAIARVLDAMPQLAALEVTPTVFVPHAMARIAARPLQTLALGTPAIEDLAALARSTAATTLRALRMSCTLRDRSHYIELFDALPQLHTLELDGDQLDLAIEALCSSTRAVRILRLRSPLRPDLIAELPALELLELWEHTKPRHLQGGFGSLFHATPASMCEPFTPVARRTPPASITHGGSTSQVGGRPVDEPLTFGGSELNQFVFPGLAPFHGAFYRIGDRWEVHGFHGNQVRINDGPPAVTAVLTDGDELNLGGIRFAWQAPVEGGPLAR